uniref:LicD family protein n=1 Tax=Elaeophora elaphi TaxID=1147741 RepID=A0A0R3RT46_9BILA
MQAIQTHFIDDNQLHIGAENLDDILESNAVMMAFFARHKLDIVGISSKYLVQTIHHYELSNISSSAIHKHCLVIFRKLSEITANLFYPLNIRQHQIVNSMITEHFNACLNFRFAIVSYETQNETFLVPANWTTFLWTLRRSRFINCMKDFAVQFRKTYPQFFTNKPIIPNEIILTLRKFRNWAIERAVTPMLYAGTLLGWYRECGIISHTHDIDFAVFIEEHYDEFPQDIMNASFMELSLRLNKPEDLLEYKVCIENNIPMDIFFLYHDQNSSWVGGLSYENKFVYPLINQTCATDLLGYLMYVPCNALNVIMSEHGENWTEPLHSSKYIWNESPLNMREAGTIPPEERAESYVSYER